MSQYRTQAGPDRQQNAQPRQTEYRKQGDSSVQDDTYRQNHAETSRQGGNPTGHKITIDVILGGPVYGGSVSGAKKSLSEYRHLVNALSVEERPRPSPMFSISFSEEDAKGIVFPHDDLLVLILTVNGADINRALVDGGSSANILFARTFDTMRIGRKYLTPVSYPVIGLNRSMVRPEGSIVLQVRMGEGPAVRDVMAEFLVIDVPSSYNAIVGRPLIHDMQVVVSPYYLTMVYVSNAGTTERVRGSQIMARECYVSALKQSSRQRTCEQTPSKRERVPSAHDLAMEIFNTRPVTAPRPSPRGETVEIELQPGVPGMVVRVGSDMDVDTRGLGCIASIPCYVGASNFDCGIGSIVHSFAQLPPLALDSLSCNKRTSDHFLHKSHKT
uniref:Uncharacterized protein n=1 Tax=Chenopodium quinoa TaxID=63459 RepID=A0A803M1Y5_CHEQI